MVYYYPKLMQVRHGSLMVIAPVLIEWSRFEAWMGDTLFLLWSWKRHYSHITSLHPGVQMATSTNLILGVTLQWTSIPSRGEQKYSQSLHATETRDKPQAYGPLLKSYTKLQWTHIFIKNLLICRFQYYSLALS